MKGFTIYGNGSLVDGLPVNLFTRSGVPHMYVGDWGRGGRPVYIPVGKLATVTDGRIYHAGLITTKSGHPLLVEEGRQKDDRTLLLIGPHHAKVWVKFEKQACPVRGHTTPEHWRQCPGCGTSIPDPGWGNPFRHPASGEGEIAPLPEARGLTRSHRVQVIAWARRGAVSAYFPRWQTPAFLLILYPGARLEVRPETDNRGYPLGSWKEPRVITWNGEELHISS